jgi:hypothetical protein
LEPVNEETPELIFDRAWVLSILVRVQGLLREEYIKAGRLELFDVLLPIMTKQPDASTRTAACEKLELSSAAVAMSIHRMRRKYGELLRSEVAATISDDENPDDEIRHLLAILDRSGK